MDCNLPPARKIALSTWQDLGSAFPTSASLPSPHNQGPTHSTLCFFASSWHACDRKVRLLYKKTLDGQQVKPGRTLFLPHTIRPSGCCWLLRSPVPYSDSGTLWFPFVCDSIIISGIIFVDIQLKDEDKEDKGVTTTS